MYLEYDSPTSIIGCGRVKLEMKDKSIITLPEVLHIPNLEINLIYVGNMDVAGVKTMGGDGGCKMVRGSMVSMRGVWFGNLYKLFRSTIIDECNSSVVLEEGGKDDRTLIASRGKTMLWHQRLGHIREKGL